ncbi:MAG: amidohydrolase family protein [Phycisphaeraceae bacterium]|nr:amidohydrolase family protein [Phycisphaeraceae bacterium]
MAEKALEISGLLMRPEADGRVSLHPGRVVIRGGRIELVERTGENLGGRTEGTGSERADELVICPGFVDAHVHLPQFDSIGSDGLTLLEWLNARIFPAEMRWADAGYARAMAGRVAKRLLASGTTAVCAFSTVHRDATVEAMRALDAAGVRGFVGQALMDRGGPGALNRPAAQLLEELAGTAAVGDVWPVVSPRFALSCTMGLMEGAGRLARERGWPVQTHFAEMVPECVRVAEEFDGAGYLEVYERAGLLGARTVLAHGVWATEAERARMAETGTVVAHCPTANLFLGSGLMDWMRMAGRARPDEETGQAGRLSHQGVRLALGSDVAGGPDVCMVRVARMMVESARARVLMGQTPIDDLSRYVPSAAECWWRITRGNAEALGLGDAGRIEEGCRGDLVVLRPGVGAAAFPAWMEQPDPLAGLLYGFDERWISEVWARGERAV